jgi:hypothetical protein
VNGKLFGMQHSESSAAAEFLRLEDHKAMNCNSPALMLQVHGLFELQQNQLLDAEWIRYCVGDNEHYGK